MRNLKNGKHILSILVTLALIIMSSRFCIAAIQMQGHYPVSSKGEYCTRPNPSELPHNPYYKMWCQKNFNNGIQIYEAYRQVAFNIEYTPEPPRVDTWQTPFETMQSRTGDCEDAILLFHDLLPHRYNDGEIVWGVVVDYQKNIKFAHVWFELYDKEGNAYIVEPYSGDWNGIIPVDNLRDREARHRIVGISNQLVSDLMRRPSQHENIKREIIKQVVMFDWRLISQVDDVFSKLTQVSQRQLMQKER